MIRSLKNTWAVLEKKEKQQFSRLMICDILVSLLDIFSLAVLLWIVRIYLDPSDDPVSVLPLWAVQTDPAYLVAFFFLLFMIKNAFAFVVNRAQFRLAAKVAIRISANNLAAFQHAGFDEYINIDSSVQVRKIGFQPFEFCQYMLSGMQQIITQATLVTITIIAILLFNARLFLLLLLVLLPPVIVVFYYIRRRLGKLRSGIRTNNERSFQHMLDALKGYVESNIYGKNDFFLKRFIHHRRRFSLHLFDSMGIQVIPSRVIEIFAIAGLFVLMAIASWTGSNDSSTILTVGAFLAAAYKIIPGMVKLINLSGQMKAFEFSPGDLSSSMKMKNIQKAPMPLIRSIEMQELDFSYKDHVILKGMNFKIDQGDFIGISGRSGIGKTSLLNLILGFLKPDHGIILVNGEPYDPSSLQKLWPQLSYVRQQSFFIHDTIIKNITLEEETSNPEQLNCALEISGVKEMVENFESGLEQVLSENGKNISGGQQQRISIARALYKNAHVILLDEPFNELDKSSEIQLLQHFKKLAVAGKIIILITHQPDSLLYCSKIISLDGQS